MASFTLEETTNFTHGQSCDIGPVDDYIYTFYSGADDASKMGIKHLPDGSGTGDHSSHTYSTGDASANSIRWRLRDWVAIAYQSVVEIVDVSDVNNPSTEATLTQAGNTVNDVAWSPDGNYVAYASDDGFTYVHDVDPANSWPLNTSVQTYSSSHGTVEFSYDSSWMAVEEGANKVIYSTSDWSVVNDTDLSGIDDMSFHHDDSYLYADSGEILNTPYENYVVRYDTSDWSSSTPYLYEQGTQTDLINTVHQTPTSTFLLAAGGGQDNDGNYARVFDAFDGSSYISISDPTNSVNDVRFSDDGSWFVAASDDGNVYVYSVTTAQFSGTVTDTNSNAISGATVYAINASDGTLTGTATTDSNGAYSISAPDTTTQHHLIVQYDDGTTKYNALSKPYVTAS